MDPPLTSGEVQLVSGVVIIEAGGIEHAGREDEIEAKEHQEPPCFHLFSLVFKPFQAFEPPFQSLLEPSKAATGATACSASGSR